MVRNGEKCAGLPASSRARIEMALAVLFLAGVVNGANPSGEMMLANITRFASGDLFSLVGSDCGPTRCMELSHGTALAAMGSDTCLCQCRRETPAFREDQKVCVNHIEECPMASFGRGATKPQIPFAFLPMKGQIIYPSKEIIFTDVEDAICAVTSAQYLSPSGWVTLRDLLDNDVPFSLYRDEGSTFLQWRGSPALHARLEGRLVAAHVLCSAPAPARLAASCAAFRVAGASHHPLFDVPSIPFHAGEIVTSEPSQSQGLSVLESLAIGVCVLMLIFVYAAGIIFYVHYKQRQKRKDKDPENNTMSTDNGSNLGSRIDLDNVTLKTNPLLKMDNLGNLGDFLNDAGLSDVSEHTEETLDSTPSTHNSHKFQKLNSSVISAMVHTRKMKKPLRPSLKLTGSDRLTPERLHERLQRRSASPEIERVPHSELSIVDCSMENSMMDRASPLSEGEPAMRRKLYFNPVFFETEHLKNPPPAAIEFLDKIREVMSIAKDRMTTKRFIPNLSDIPEEESYHSVDLGWDIPCARRGRRFSAISLKRENSRRSAQCSGCPGCDREPAPALVRSNSCKSCVSDDYKQKIVRKWLDDVPSPTPRVTATRPVKSVAKVSGTQRTTDINTPEPQAIPRLPEPKQTEKIADFDSKDQIKALRVKELPTKKEALVENSVKKQEQGEVLTKKEIQANREKPVVVEMSMKKDVLLRQESMKEVNKELVKELQMKKNAVKESPAKIIKVEETPVKKDVVKTKENKDDLDVARPSKLEHLRELSAKIAKEIPLRKDNLRATSDVKKDVTKEYVQNKETPKETSVRKDLLRELTAKKDFVKEIFMKKEQAKEMATKRDFKTEKPKIIHNVPLDKESGICEPEYTNIGNSNVSAVSLEQQSPTLSTVSSEKTPVSHLSQRLRHKLPPPPPPPITMPKQIAPSKSEVVISESPAPKEDEAPIPLEVKVKMEAVIQELHKCTKELIEDEIPMESAEPIPPKIVIPVIAADTHYFSDDNTLRKQYTQREPFIDFDSMERNLLKKRRFSLACGPELAHRMEHIMCKPDLPALRDTLTRSWRDVRHAVENHHFITQREKPVPSDRRNSISHVFVNDEPLYDNLSQPGPLTIKVTGSPGEVRRNVCDEHNHYDFEPDTLDRKPVREAKKRIEQILLKSGGSFKHKDSVHECDLVRSIPASAFNRKIGSLRQMYEEKTKLHKEEMRLPYYGRRGSLPYGGHELADLVKSVTAADLIRQLESQKDVIKPPIPPKQRRPSELSPKFMRSPIGEKRATRSPEERERYQMYLRGENLKRSGRRSNRTRSRRTDIRKLYRTEDSGYLSTDSNESKRRASYLLQLRPKAYADQSGMPLPPTIVRTPILQHIESDTDDLESICDGRSESGGESIETDSVFFGNFDESKQMLAELGLSAYDIHRKLHHHEQIDSGFMGETNIILSGDSDSEHRSVISIVTGRDGRTSSASITQLEDAPYKHSVEC